jgi:hypothetical protein
MSSKDSEGMRPRISFFEGGNMKVESQLTSVISDRGGIDGMMGGGSMFVCVDNAAVFLKGEEGNNI